MSSLLRSVRSLRRRCANCTCRSPSRPANSPWVDCFARSCSPATQKRPSRDGACPVSFLGGIRIVVGRNFESELNVCIPARHDVLQLLSTITVELLEAFECLDLFGRIAEESTNVLLVCPCLDESAVNEL